MPRRQVAGQHQADLVGEDLFAGVIHHPATVAVAVKAEREVGALRAHRLGHGVQHLRVFGIGVVAREIVVEIAIHLDDLGAHPPQARWREGPGRAVAAGADHLQRPLELAVRCGVGDIALGHAFYLGERPAGPGLETAAEHDLLQSTDLIRPEGHRWTGSHLHASPAVLVVAGGDHGHAGRVEVELGKIGDRRQRQADIEHLAAGGDQAERQGLLHRQRIRPVVVADDDPRPAELMDIGPQAHAKRLDAQQVEIRAQQPARVVLAKAGWLDQRRDFIGRGVGQEVAARGGEHRPRQSLGCRVNAPPGWSAPSDGRTAPETVDPSPAARPAPER